MEELEFPPTLRTSITLDDEGGLFIKQFADGNEDIVYLAPHQLRTLAEFLIKAFGPERAD